jgi:hypothetical protein
LVQSLLKGGDASVTLDSPDDSRENLLRALGDSPADLPRRLFGLLPANVKISETFTIGEPTVVKMGNDDLSCKTLVLLLRRLKIVNEFADITAVADGGGSDGISCPPGGIAWF